MNTLRRQAQVWLEADVATVCVRVSESSGSTPQGAGAIMLVTRSLIAGTIGGGHLEWQAINKARALLEQPVPAPASNVAPPPQAVPLEQSYALGPSLGQCCGGSVRLRFEIVDRNVLKHWPDETRLFALHLFGMGHVARALVRTLLPLNCSIDWYDTRAEQVDATVTLFGVQQTQASLRFHEGAAPEFDSDSHNGNSDKGNSCDRDRNPSGVPRLALVMTHRHDLDLDVCRQLLLDERWALTGLIGSATKKIRFLRRLQQAGLTNEQLDRLCCPIGLPGIKHKQPEPLAITIAAQLLQACQSPAPSRIASSLEYANV